MCYAKIRKGKITNNQYVSIVVHQYSSIFVDIEKKTIDIFMNIGRGSPPYPSSR